MAKIPMGNFGNAMTQVQRIQMPQRNTGELANALSNSAQLAGQVAQQKDEAQREAELQAKRTELYHNQIAEQEAKVKIDDVLTKDMSEQVTLVKNDVANGVYDAKTGDEALRAWSSEKYKQLENEMPLHAQQQLKQYWDGNVNQQTTSLLPLQLRADAQKSVALVDRATDIATRYDRAKGREYLQTYLGTAQMSEAEKSERLQKYDTTRDILDIDDRITVALSNKDTQELQTLITDLDAGKYAYLDGPTAQQKKTQALSRIDAINTQVKAEENKRVQDAGKFFNEFKSQVLTGRMLDDDYRNNVRDAVRGTEHEADFTFYDKQSANFQSFSRKSTSEQAKLISQQKANMKNSTTSDAVTEQKILGVYESLYKEKLANIKANPNQAVKEVGLEVHSLTAVDLKTNPSYFIKNAIDNGSSQLALKDANLKLMPISAEDLPEVKKAFDEKNVDQKLSFIGGLIQQAQGMKDGRKVWGAILNQLGGDDRTYLLAGLAKSKNRKIGNQNLADTIMQGQALIKSGGFVIPSDLEGIFRERYGNLSQYGAFSDDFKKFQYSYAAMASGNGLIHKDKKDTSDVNTINKAFELATGGAYVQDAGWFSSFKNSNGDRIKSWKVPKPYGWTDDKFSAYIEKEYEQLSKQSGYSESELKGFRLAPYINKNSQDVAYELVNEAGKRVVGESGKPQLIIFQGVSR